jgi:hypothetical protein
MEKQMLRLQSVVAEKDKELALLRGHERWGGLSLVYHSSTSSPPHHLTLPTLSTPPRSPCRKLSKDLDRAQLLLAQVPNAGATFSTVAMQRGGRRRDYALQRLPSVQRRRTGSWSSESNVRAYSRAQVPSPGLVPLDKVRLYGAPGGERGGSAGEKGGKQGKGKGNKAVSRLVEMVDELRMAKALAGTRPFSGDVCELYEHPELAVPQIKVVPTR